MLNRSVYTSSSAVPLVTAARYVMSKVSLYSARKFERKFELESAAAAGSCLTSAAA